MLLLLLPCRILPSLWPIIHRLLAAACAYVVAARLVQRWHQRGLLLLRRRRRRRGLLRGGMPTPAHTVAPGRAAAAARLLQGTQPVNHLHNTEQKHK